MSQELCMCGTEDCPYCHPDRFVGTKDYEQLIDEVIYQEMENECHECGYEAVIKYKCPSCDNLRRS